MDDDSAWWKTSLEFIYFSLKKNMMYMLWRVAPKKT